MSGQVVITLDTQNRIDLLIIQCYSGKIFVEKTFQFILKLANKPAV